MSSCSSSSSSPSPPNKWATLPTDILDVLVRSLQSSFDRLRLGAVCRAWRDVAAAVVKQNPTGSRCGVPVLPIMTFIEPVVAGVKGGPVEAPMEEVDQVNAAATPVTRCFYSLSEDKVYRLQVPSESREWRCFGSSRGWLGMIDLSLNIFLFDPISGARVDLPPLTTLGNIFRFTRRRKKDGAILYVFKGAHNDCVRGGGYTATEARDLLINKLALSSPPLDSNSCIAMALIEQLPAYARAGGDCWAHVPKIPPQSWFRDDILYHDGRFYTVATYFYTVATYGETIAVDFKDPKSLNGDLAPPTFEIIVRSPPPYPIYDRRYLVALPSGEIVQVFRFVHDGRKSYRTWSFNVYKLKVGSGGEGGHEWVEDDCIGDCCLFLGSNESVSLPPFQVLGKYRTNSIFFTDDIDDQSYDGWGHDFGIYDFEEETVDKFCHIDARQLTPPPMWLTSPSL